MLRVGDKFSINVEVFNTDINEYGHIRVKLGNGQLVNLSPKTFDGLVLNPAESVEDLQDTIEIRDGHIEQLNERIKELTESPAAEIVDVGAGETPAIDETPAVDEAPSAEVPSETAKKSGKSGKAE